MLLPCNSYAFTFLQLCFSNSPTLISLGGLWGENGWELTSFATLLTYIHNFSGIIPEKYFFVKEVPPFHLTDVITLVINRLDRVELWWNYGWNYMKFHP